MSSNRAIWQDKPGVKGVIRDDPLPNLEAQQLRIRVHSWAINPADVLLQDKEIPIFTYPVILGSDIAGIVEDVGSVASSKFKTGDRVFGCTGNNGFKELVTLDMDSVAIIPAALSFSEASVFPLCVVTASFGLFSQEFLNLPLPNLTPVDTRKSVLIWGGSSAVGCNAIQLCKAAGFHVVATCSPRSFDFVKGLGADQVFDYNNPTVTDEVAAELDKGQCAGIYLAAGKVAAACQVSHKSQQKLFVSSTNMVEPGDAPEGVEAKWHVGRCVDYKERVLAVAFGGFLTDALAAGKYKIAPPPKVVSKNGLDGIQSAMDILREGVSTTKIVVEVS